jgi:acetate kinase
MLGLTGFSDLREIELQAEENASCQLALDMNAYRIKKTIGYTAVMNGLDAIIFTAGMGRILLISGNKYDMEYFGMELDEAKNEIRSKEMREINTAHSKTKIMVIPTNEEMEIANQVYDLLIS